MDDWQEESMKKLVVLLGLMILIVGATSAHSMAGYSPGGCSGSGSGTAYVVCPGGDSSPGLPAAACEGPGVQKCGESAPGAITR